MSRPEAPIDRLPDTARTSAPSYENVNRGGLRVTKAMTSGGQIVVHLPVLAEPCTVSYRLDCTGPLRGYFTSRRMFARYDVDVTDVPDSLLLVPLLGTIAPIAWLLDAELRVPVVDATFLGALRRVKQSLRELHPALPWGGEIRAESVATDTGETGERSALLFSGGVDSLASYVGHRDEKPLLVSVWGADVGLHQRPRWQQVAAANRTFASDHGLDITFVDTNFRTFFNQYKLRARFLPSFDNWYSGVQQGLGLVTLCAPLTHTHRVRRVLIPSSFTPDWGRPWGSHPSIDDHVRWGVTETIHDGYEFGRQMKLERLAEYVRENDARLPLRVCWGRAVNCSRCTKCSLTVVGLLLAGLPPSEHGFRFDASTLAEIRHKLAEGRLPLSDAAAWSWTELQGHIPGRRRVGVEGLDEFVSWLGAISIEDCRTKSKARRRSRMRRYLETRPEPVGRWIRRAIGHPFP